MCRFVMGQSVGDKCLAFSGTVGMRGNLFAHLNRVVIEGSRGVCKRVKRQDEGSRTDFLNFPARCSRRSVRLGTAAQ